MMEGDKRHRTETELAAPAIAELSDEGPVYRAELLRVLGTCAVVAAKKEHSPKLWKTMTEGDIASEVAGAVGRLSRVPSRRLEAMAMAIATWDTEVFVRAMLKCGYRVGVDHAAQSFVLLQDGIEQVRSDMGRFITKEKFESFLEKDD